MNQKPQSIYRNSIFCAIISSFGFLLISNRQDMLIKSYVQVFILLFASLSVFSQNTSIIRFSKPLDEQQAIAEYITRNGLDPNSDFHLISSKTDRLGITHNKYQQTYNGIKVEYGTLILHIKDGKVTSANGEVYTTIDVSVSTSVTEDNALQTAMNYIGADRYSWNDKTVVASQRTEKPRALVVLYPDYATENRTLRLAYKFDIQATYPVKRDYVYVDANTSQVLFDQPIIKHIHYSEHEASEMPLREESILSTQVAGTADTKYSGNRTIETRQEPSTLYTLHDESRNVHTYNALNSENSNVYENTFIDFEDNDNVWSAAEHDNAAQDIAALDAHWGAMEVIDYWATLGRDSFDDNGAEIRSYVHVGTDFPNAYWNGKVMSYGDGDQNNPFVSLDVVSHEIAHAVTTWTANLVYARESGAINEGFSDIFGAATEHFAKGSGTDANPDANVWLLAEEFWPDGYLRSMEDPKSKGDPDTYNGSFYTDATDNCVPTAQNDACGVHSNSGVLNHWFYILVVGKSGTNDVGDAYNVTGIGMNKAEEITYLTLRDYLSPNSNYLDTRNAAIEVASNLYGVNSAERQAVQDAFYAVNVGEEFVPYNTDVQLVSFVDLQTISCGEAIVPTVKVRNTGVSTTITALNFDYSIGGVSQPTYNWTGSIAVGAEEDIALPSVQQSNINAYELVVDVVLAGDEDASNNSLTEVVSFNFVDANPTVVNGFEGILDFWLAYESELNSNPWMLGEPNKTILNQAALGQKAYVTLLDANYPNDTKAYLVTPCYDLTAHGESYTLKFNMQFELQENFDILYVEYTTDSQNWQILGTATDPNWYNSDRVFLGPETDNDCQNCPGAQWTGSSNGIQQYSKDISFLSSESNVKFRFVFHSDASVTDEGVMIDNFVIGDADIPANTAEYIASLFNVYPNPTTGQLFIEAEDRAEVVLYSSQGRLITKFNVQTGTNTFDFTDYATGVYILKITTNEGQAIKRVIKQ